MPRKLALLRAVNVGGRKVPMADLRELCASLGWKDVETYIQSGNILFSAPGADARSEAVLEKAMADRYGFDVPVIVQTAEQWSRHAAGSPFPEAEENSANLLMLCVSKKPLAPGAADALQERAKAGERVREKDGALWVHYRDGVGGSKLSPALFDRIAGSTVTARNWRTVLKLQDMLRA